MQDLTQVLEIERVPAFDAEPHDRDPLGVLAAWWTDPPGVVLQFTRPARGTHAMVEWLVDEGLERLKERFAGESGLRVIFDMRSMTGRSATARSLLLRRGLALFPLVNHVVVLPSVHLGPGYAGVVESGARLLRLAGIRVDVDHDLDRVLRVHRIELAPARCPKRPGPVRHPGPEPRSLR